MYFTTSCLDDHLAGVLSDDFTRKEDKTDATFCFSLKDAQGLV